MPGPPPKPAALRARRNRKPEGAPDPDLPLGPCPRHLGQAARAEWRRLAATLVETGALCGLDRGLFVRYCETWGRLLELDRRRPRKMTLRVEVARERQALDGHLLRLAAELRLTPVSRTRAPLPTRRPVAPAVATPAQLPPGADPRLVLRFTAGPTK